MMKASSNMKGGEAPVHSEHGGTSAVVQPASFLGTSLGNRATAALFEETVGPPRDRLEQEANRAAERVARGETLSAEGLDLSLAAGGRLQRKCAKCEREDEEEIGGASKGSEAGTEAEAGPAIGEAPAEQEAASTEAAAEAPAAVATPALLVNDTADAEAGQMHKTEFMDALQAEVCAAANQVLATVGRDTEGCPWVEYWFNYYGEQDAPHIERAIRRYAPEAAEVTTAADYIGIVTARVRGSVDVWVKTGEVTGVPSPAGAGGETGAGPTKPRLFFKARRGGTRSADPISVSQQLGAGQPLPGTVRARMESAFGANFAAVRLHSDSKAAALSDQLNARAFAVGQHVAFGPGEFRPGTIAGDALIAHELAHVVQQSGSPAWPLVGKSWEGESAIEADADRSATAAVASLWMRGQEASIGIARKVMPAIRSGLQLSRCSKKKTGKAQLKSGPAYTPSGTIRATKSGGQKSATFKLSAEFENDPAKGLDPSCGEVRQYIKWTKAADIPNHAGFKPASAYSANTWYEDRDDVGKRYGHRSGTYYECASINHYLNKGGGENCTSGEVFDGKDDPIDGSGAKTGEWNFELRAVDTCDGDKEIGTAASVTVDWNV
jgi:hypothetical protein